MGWLFMRDMDGYAVPRSYLDNQFTYARDDHRLTVLASSMVASTYYAACERIEANGDRQVFAVVCLTKHNPRSTDGHVFGYKDMRSEEHTSELQSLMRISYAGLCLKKKKTQAERRPIPQPHIQGRRGKR